MKKIKLFEMFAGYGGGSFALKKAGVDYEVIGFSEIDRVAIQCYLQNHGDVKNYGDCTKINPEELPDFDLLTGGFPCQAFSNAGKMQGELDTRGTLVYDIIRIAEHKQPRYMLLENVKGFTFKKFKDTFDKVLSELDRIGYRVYWQVLNSKDFGIPQNRERVWFVCIRKDIEKDFKFPSAQKSLLGYDTEMSKPEIGQAKRVYGTSGVSPPLNCGWTPLIEEKEEHKPLTLKDILEEEVDEKYYLTAEQLQKIYKHSSIKKEFGSCALRTWPRKSGMTEQEKKNRGKALEIRGDEVANTITTHQNDSMIVEIKDHKSYISWKDSKNRFNTQDHRAFKEDMYSGTIPAMERGIPKVVCEQRTDEGLRFFKNNVCGSLRTTDSCGDKRVLESFRIRKLTPKECFRLMGFVNDEINLEGIKETKILKTCRKYINLWEIKSNAKCLLVKEKHKQKDTGTFVSFIIKENIKLELQDKLIELDLQETLNVDIAIKKLEKREQKDSVIDITKCGEITTEMLYILIKKKLDLKSQDMQDVSMVVQHTKSLWKITLKDLCEKKKLFIISMVTNLIIQSKIFTYVKTEANILASINNLNMSQCNLLEVDISSLKMEYMSSPLSESQRYKLAGNGWEINVVSKIFKQLF